MQVGTGGLRTHSVQGVLPVKVDRSYQGGGKQNNSGEKQVAPCAGLDRNELDGAVNKVNITMGLFENGLSFMVHEKTNRIIVRLVNNHTGEVIKEIPPEKMLDIAADILEMIGLIIDKHA